MIVSNESSGHQFLGYTLQSFEAFLASIQQNPEELAKTLIVSTNPEETEQLLSAIKEEKDSELLSQVDIINITDLIKRNIN